MPAATDLIVAMGAADHLVAVSNWETRRPEIANLPSVGDYQTTDWEKLAQLRPDLMIVFMGQRMPAGLKQRADDLHIRLINVATDRLDEIFQTVDLLGELLKEPEKAAALKGRMHGQIDAVAGRVAGAQPIPTLIARDDEGYALVGKNTFIDELLTIAGGKNVAGDFSMYPSVDRERVMEMSPQVIIQLWPNASKAVSEQAKHNWEQLKDLPAVKSGRVYVLTEWYVLQPGSHIGDLAERFAQILHPQNATTSQP